MANDGALLQMSAEQRQELDRWTQSRTLPCGDVFRARIVLALADGLSYREIERKLGASSATIALWKSRFERSGIDGLQRGLKGLSREPRQQLCRQG
jgi:DNA-directed RNA polymerase specialized sigma24 family protein